MVGAVSYYDPYHEYRPHHYPHLLAAGDNSHVSQHAVEPPDAADLAHELTGAH